MTALELRRGRWWFLLLALTAALAWSCTVETGEKRTLTERQRDSTIAASPLPGAATVSKAMEVADSAAARRQRSVPESP